MVSRDIPRDISKYEAKLMLGLTTRQVCLYVPGVAAALLVFFMLKGVLGDLALFLAILTALPFILFASFKPLGMPMEQFLKTSLLEFLFAPANRRYQIENTYSKTLKPVSQTATGKSNKKYMSKDKTHQAV